jgi:cystathionine beta-synthase
MWRTKGEAKPEGTPYKVEGIGQDKVPGTLDMGVVDDFMTVSDKEAFAMARRLTREEGLFVGGSSGLVVHVALHVARRLDDPDALIVVPLPDTGERYLSKLYNDEWMRENQLLDADRTTLGSVLGAKEPRGEDTPVIVSVAPGATVRQALRLMALHDVSQLPVMEGANCVGSVSDWSLSAKGLEDSKLLDATVSQVMDGPFPIVDVGQPVDSVAKLLSKSNPAVLVRSNGSLQGIVTRSDMLTYMMAR